jgi:hypothetical protein
MRYQVDIVTAKLTENTVVTMLGSDSHHFLEGYNLGLLLLVILVVLLLAALVGGGGYTYRRYYGPGAGTVVEDGGGGGGGAAALAILILVVLVILFLIWMGVVNWGWLAPHATNVNVTTHS